MYVHNYLANKNYKMYVIEIHRLSTLYASTLYITSNTIAITHLT